MLNYSSFCPISREYRTFFAAAYVVNCNLAAVLVALSVVVGLSASASPVRSSRFVTLAGVAGAVGKWATGNSMLHRGLAHLAGFLYRHAIAWSWLRPVLKTTW